MGRITQKNHSREYEILGLGNVTFNKTHLQIQAMEKWSVFFKKYSEEFIKLPDSLISAIKSATNDSSKPIKYNSRYYRTLKDFFSTIQVHSLKDTQDLSNSNRDKDFKNLFRQKMDNFAKQKFSTFLIKRYQQNSLYPTNSHFSILDYQKKRSLAYALELLNTHKYDLARKELNTFLRSPHQIHLNAKELDRIKSCVTFLKYYEQSEKIIALIEEKKINRADKMFMDLIHDFQNENLSDELSIPLKKQITSIEKYVKKNVQNFHQLIQKTLDSIPDLIGQQNYQTAMEKIALLESIANINDILQLKHICSKFKSEILKEYQIYEIMLDFLQHSYPRIHISEIERKTTLEVQEIQRIIKKLIDQGSIRASFDEKSQGIEFHFLQENIDELLLKFQQWESEEWNKKSI